VQQIYESKQALILQEKVIILIETVAIDAVMLCPRFTLPVHVIPPQPYNVTSQ